MATRVLAAAATSAAAVALIAGCSLLPGGDAASGGDASSSAAPEESAPASDGEGAGDGPGVQDIDVEDVVVEQTVTMPDQPEDETTIGVHSLVVEGDVMVLRLVLTPQFASESDSASISQFSALGDQNLRPRLLDGENLKEYSVVGSGGWASSDLGVETVNGSPMLSWAYYAAPEDDIDTVDIRIADVWPPFTDVPITR